MTELEVGKEYWFKGRVAEVLEEDYPFAPYKVGFNDWGAWMPVDVEAVEAIQEREKVTIPKKAADFISGQKNLGHGVLEALEEASLLTKLDVIDWLKPVENQEKFLKAWVLGYTTEEPLGVLLVDMPGRGFWKYNFLRKSDDGRFLVDGSDKYTFLENRSHKLTEAEAKEKYPNFKWVSLEELENES